MAEFKFTEKEDYEQGFSQVYDQEMAPYLRQKEADRQNAITRSKRWMYLSGAITAVLAWQAMKLDPFLPIFPIFFGGCLVLLLYLNRFGKMQRDITNFLRPVLCNFFPDIVYSDLHPGESFSVNELRYLNIIPTSDKSSFGPSISGHWRGTQYRLTKASFYNERTDSDGDRKRVYLFSGIILEIGCLIEMPTIVFYPDFGDTMNKVYSWAVRNNRPPHKLTLADAALEKVFEVYTSDLEKAGAHLHPDFGAKLLAFSREYQQAEKYISAAFQGRKFYLAIDLPHDFMNFDVGKKPLWEANDAIHKALADLMIPRKIIDSLLSDVT